jgi:hypothetical protein
MAGKISGLELFDDTDIPYLSEILGFKAAD